MVAPKRQRPCFVADDLLLYAFGQISASGLGKIGLALIVETQQRGMAYIFVLAAEVLDAELHLSRLHPLGRRRFLIASGLWAA